MHNVCAHVKITQVFVKGLWQTGHGSGLEPSYCCRRNVSVNFSALLLDILKMFATRIPK